MTPVSNKNIEQLIQNYGSPLFIVSSEKLISNMEAFKSAFENKYPEIVVAYSYKVNYLPEVLKVIHNQGAWAEAASGFEYDIARKLKIPGHNIVFNGPFKTKGELESAVQQKSIINVDHLDELELLEIIASELGDKIDIGLRVNMKVGIDQLPDRFGFNIESGEALRIVERCNSKDLLNIKGLHVHLTSYIIEKESEDNVPAKGIKLIWPKDHNAYRYASQKITRFAKVIEEKFGIEIEYLDMGGGFPTVDSIGPYVDAITYPLLSKFNQNTLPTLILEPGRAIVSNAIDLITTVAAIKFLPGRQRAIIVDAGINILPTSFWKYQDVECLSKAVGNLEETIVYGPLCLQTDIISKTKLPELKPGDLLRVKNVGAYNISQSSTFIYAQPAVILREDKNFTVIRNKEVINDLFKI